MSPLNCVGCADCMGGSKNCADCVSSGLCGLIKFWRGSKILQEGGWAGTNLNNISRIFASIHVFWR